MITYFDSMLVCEVLAIIMVDNLEVLTGDDQGVVVVLVVDHQRVATGSEKVSFTFTSSNGSNGNGAV